MLSIVSSDAKTSGTNRQTLTNSGSLQTSETRQPSVAGPPPQPTFIRDRQTMRTRPSRADALTTRTCSSPTPKALSGKHPHAPNMRTAKEQGLTAQTHNAPIILMSDTQDMRPTTFLAEKTGMSHFPSLLRSRERTLYARRGSTPSGGCSSGRRARCTPHSDALSVLPPTTRPSTLLDLCVSIAIAVILHSARPSRWRPKSREPVVKGER